MGRERKEERRREERGSDICAQTESLDKGKEMPESPRGFPRRKKVDSFGKKNKFSFSYILAVPPERIEIKLHNVSFPH